MAELNTLVDRITKDPSKNRIKNFVYEIAHHVYVNQPIIAYVEVGAFGTDTIRCVFSADTKLSPNRIIDIALHERRHLADAVSFSDHHRKMIENEILNYGIRCDKDNCRYLRMDTEKLALPEFDAGDIDKYFFPGSHIMKAINADGVIPVSASVKVSGYGLVQEGMKRGYDIPSILERINRFYVGLFNQKLNGVVNGSQKN